MDIFNKNKRIFKPLIPLLFLVWFLSRLGNIGINTVSATFKYSKLVFKEVNKPLPKSTFWEKIDEPKKKGKNHNLFWKVLKIIFSKKIRLAFLSVAITACFITYSYSLVKIANDLPSPKKLLTLPTPTTTEFYDRNGTLLYRFYEGKNRTPVKLSQIPTSLIQATISVEDKNFYSHFGVDFYGIARAGLSLLKNGDVQGGSTITQQLIKNTLLTPERTFDRKLKEIILAFWAERIFTKNEILEMYFNEVPYGGPAWGISAAARTYFDKDVSELTLPESAFLAGLPASPTSYSPYGTNPDLAKTRQAQALRRMVEDGYINQQTADEALNEELAIKLPVNEIKAPHFVMYVRNKLSEKYGPRFVSQGGLKIYTTLDFKLQEKAEEILSEEVEKIKSLNVTNGAAMITDAKTGQILAMVGSKNYWDPVNGNFNVTTALRQPGSSIKPITYATAFKQGFSPGSTLLDTPISFRNFWENYTPVNYDGRFRGPVTIRTALGSSLNVPAVKLLSIVGIPDMLKTAHDLGITTLNDPNRYGLSLTLGGGEVKMIDMMTVYGTFSQLGTKYPAQDILYITDSKGNTLENNSHPIGETVLQPSIAYLISDILSDNKARTPAFGPNSLLVIPGHQVAVKTGTTDSKRDNWTFGYTPEFVVGVWVGNNDNTPMNPQLTSGVTGASPIWNRLISEVLRNRPSLAFEKPSDVIIGNVDGHKDLIVSGIQPKSATGQNKKKIKDAETDKEKEVITFTDPFSTYQSDQSGQPVLTSP
jgi:1A family penicillin-binding protein